MNVSGQLSAEQHAYNVALSRQVLREMIAEQKYPKPTSIEGDHLKILPPSLLEKINAREIIYPQDCDFPIPPIREDGWLAGGWRDLQIEDCGEPLTPLAEGPGLIPKFHAISVYFRQDLTKFIEPFHDKGGIIDYSDPRLYARTSIAETLHAISSYLPPGLCLVTLDAYRDPRVQAALFEIQVQRLVAQGMSKDQANIMAQKFVSRPSINPPAPHTTGAAVDVALFDHVTGMLDFGTKFDSMEDQAALRFYEEQSRPEDMNVKLNRRYLYWLMRMGNFRGWPYEWWHFDHANDPVGAHISGTNNVKFGYITKATRTDLERAIPIFISSYPDFDE